MTPRATILLLTLGLAAVVILTPYVVETIADLLRRSEVRPGLGSLENDES